MSSVWAAFEPSPDIGIAEYSVRFILNEQGRPFDYLAFPHMVACGGPMDAFDSLVIREIVLQWASRLGKTFVVLCGSLYLADLAPCNQILAGPSEDIGLQQTERVRLMGAQIPRLKSAGIEDTLKKRLRFGGNTIYAAWAKSPGTLSNINASFGGFSELDLAEHLSTSKHPDPEEMFGDRFKDNDSSRKEIYESIPTLKGTYVDHNDVERPRSRIEARRLRGSNCSFWVGCLHCGCRQVLTIEHVTPDGYQCAGCSGLISNERRKEFIRSGVWAPAGCAVDHNKALKAAESRLESLGAAAELAEGDEHLPELRRKLQWNGWAECDYLVGEPVSDGTIASYQLSSLYALSLTWRRIAEERSESRNFITQWLGQTFDLGEEDEYDIEADARDLAIAITGQLPQDTLPDWCEYIILSCDRQARSLPWMLSAWDAELSRVSVLRKHSALSFNELELLLKKRWGNRGVSLAVIDSNYLTKDTLDWCVAMTKKYRMKVYPVRGTSFQGHHYKLVDIKDEKGRTARYRTIKRLDINTQSTQEWCVELLQQRNAISLWNADPSSHQELCEELLNDVETVRQSTSTWDRFRTTKKRGEDSVVAPNDQRDALRYAFCGAQLAAKLKRSKTPKTMQAPLRPVVSERTQVVGPSEQPRLL